MQSPPSLTPHRIAYVRTVGEGEGAEMRGHVFCTRLGQTLRTRECGRCPRFVRVAAGEAAGEEAVLCDARSGLLPIAEAQTPLALARVPVSALMTRNVICVRPELSLDAATQLFIESGLKAVPVVEPQGQLRGFISEAEVILAVQVGSSGGAQPSTVADIMLPFALALPETASVTQAAAVMAFEGQARLAVVSSTGALVGVLSASDIMYWLARSDGHVLPRPRPC